jgi:hypothetical protein
VRQEEEEEKGQEQLQVVSLALLVQKYLLTGTKVQILTPEEQREEGTGTEEGMRGSRAGGWRQEGVRVWRDRHSPSVTVAARLRSDVAVLVEWESAGSRGQRKRETERVERWTQRVLVRTAHTGRRQT